MNDDYENLWFKLCCYYHAKTELYDRSLTDERSKYDPTEAFISNGSRYKGYSDLYAMERKSEILAFAKKLHIPASIINNSHMCNNYRYSAQGWIDLYNYLVENGEMDFMKKIKINFMDLMEEIT